MTKQSVTTSKKMTPEIQSKIQMKISQEEKNIFKDEKQRRYKLEHRNRTLIIMSIILVISYFLAVLLPASGFQNSDISIAWYFERLGDNVASFGKLLGGEEAGVFVFVVSQCLIVVFVGAALSISGAVYQGTFRNALASPTTLGVEAGGVLGGTIFILFFVELPEKSMLTSEIQQADFGILYRYGQTIFVFAGCLLVVAFIIIVARIVNRGTFSTVTIILSGAIVGGVISEVMFLIQYDALAGSTFSAKAYMLRYLLMGTFTGAYTPQQLLLIGIPTIIVITIVMLSRNVLNLLVFGEDEAKTMGVNVEQLRLIMIIIVTMLTALAISFCGMIGFIGFIVPHVARKIVGPDFKYLIPSSGLLGGICMLVIFHVAGVLNLELNINIMTCILGGTIFIAMVIWFRSRGNADWA